jgi:hypothetical protein
MAVDVRQRPESVPFGLKEPDRDHRMAHVQWPAAWAGREAAPCQLRRSRAAAATGPRWPRCRPIELRRVVVSLPAHCGSAFGTDVVILSAAWQNEQELPSRRGRAATPRAEQTRRVELAEAVRRAAHVFNSIRSVALAGSRPHARRYTLHDQLAAALVNGQVIPHGWPDIPPWSANR